MCLTYENVSGVLLSKVSILWLSKVSTVCLTFENVSGAAQSRAKRHVDGHGKFLVECVLFGSFY